MELTQAFTELGGLFDFSGEVGFHLEFVKDGGGKIAVNKMMIFVRAEFATKIFFSELDAFLNFFKGRVFFG